MKKILCFGDSNTYGFNPENGKRFNIDSRWSGILKTKLADKYDVIEAGCNNRTAFCNNPAGEEYTGYKAIKKYLTKDIDILILSIGLNDLQKTYNLKVSDFDSGIKLLIQIAKNINPNLKIILTAPSFINENILNSYFSQLFDKSAIENSKKLYNIYKKVSEENNCIFIDLEKNAKTSNIDGLHYTKEGHIKIANALLNTI